MALAPLFIALVPAIIIFTACWYEYYASVSVGSFSVGFLVMLWSRAADISYWYNAKRRQIYLLTTLVKAVSGQEVGPHTVSFTVNDTGKSACLEYERMSHKYTLLIPYRRDYVSKMAHFLAELIRPGHLPLDITQQPGVPYLATAETLGGVNIRVTNRETGRHQVFLPSQMPWYAEDLFLDDE